MRCWLSTYILQFDLYLVAWHNLLSQIENELTLLRSTNGLLSFLKVSAAIVLLNFASAAASIIIYSITVVTLFNSLALAVATDLGLAHLRSAVYETAWVAAFAGSYCDADGAILEDAEAADRSIQKIVH